MGVPATAPRRGLVEESVALVRLLHAAGPSAAVPEHAGVLQPAPYASVVR
jgi:hypothetical protein